MSAVKGNYTLRAKFINDVETSLNTTPFINTFGQATRQFLPCEAWEHLNTQIFAAARNTFARIAHPKKSDEAVLTRPFIQFVSRSAESHQIVPHVIKPYKQLRYQTLDEEIHQLRKERNKIFEQRKQLRLLGYLTGNSSQINEVKVKDILQNTFGESSTDAHTIAPENISLAISLLSKRIKKHVISAQRQRRAILSRETYWAQQEHDSARVHKLSYRLAYHKVGPKKTHFWQILQ